MERLGKTQITSRTFAPLGATLFILNPRLARSVGLLVLLVACVTSEPVTLRLTIELDDSAGAIGGASDAVSVEVARKAVGTPLRTGEDEHVIPLLGTDEMRE